MVRSLAQFGPEDRPPSATYLVRLGHTVVEVRADNKDAAIAAARRLLSQEMPRLYDVIRDMAAHRFQVEHAA